MGGCDAGGSAFELANSDGAGLHIGAPLIATPADPDCESGEGVGGETMWSLAVLGTANLVRWCVPVACDIFVWSTAVDPDFESGEDVGGETIWESRRS